MSIAKPTDEELRELFFLFPEGKAAADRMPQIEPLKLGNAELDRFVAALGNIPEAYSRQWVRKQLAEAAEYFCNGYALQKYPRPSETARRFAAIQAAAQSLIQALEPNGAMTSDIQAYLQIAADEYGSRVRRPVDVGLYDIPWNFWSAYKLPSVIESVRLIEHWAELAQARLQRNVEENKRKKRTGNLGDPAVRVLVHRLALSWIYVRGEVFIGFTSFAREFIEAMKERLTDAQRSHFEHIGNKLSHASSEQAIRNHLRSFLAKLAASKANQAAKKNRGVVKPKRGKNR